MSQQCAGHAEQQVGCGALQGKATRLRARVCGSARRRRPRGACYALRSVCGTALVGCADPTGAGATVPRLLRPAQLSQRRCLNIISFALCSWDKAYYFTSLPSAGAVCEKETFQLMRTRGKSQHVSTFKLYACAHRKNPWVASVIQESGHNTITLRLVINLHCGKD